MSFVSLIVKSLKFATAFLFGTTGEIVGQKSGHLNMGIPGIMYFGAIGGIIGERICILIANGGALNLFLLYFLPIVFAMAFAAIGGLLFAFFTVTLHCNQNVTGLTLTTFGVGFSCYFIHEIPTGRMSEIGQLMQSFIPQAKNLGWFGEIFLAQSFYTYLAIVLAIISYFVINKTKIGLNLRAVGENPAASDAAGLNVNAYRYIATIVGAAIAGIGGLAYEMDYIKGTYNVADAVDSVGWLALCLVIFSFWNPLIGLGTSFLYGILSFLPVALPYMFNGQIFVFKIVPYVVTIAILIVASILNKTGGLGPRGLGQSYFREDR